MPPDGFHHFIECHLTKVFSIVVFASNRFNSWEARRTLFLWNFENQCYHCDYWLHWWIGLRLFMEFAQDATWWFSPLHIMSPNKCVFYCSVFQHWISLTGGKKDLVSIVVFASTGFHLTKVFSIVVFASTGFDSWEARRTFFLQKFEVQCGHCDYWLHWCIGLRLFMKFAQDATWWFSPLHRMSPNKGVFYCSVCQHWISLMGGKKDLVSIKYW
jgi:hypothetical protein